MSHNFHLPRLRSRTWIKVKGYTRSLLVWSAKVWAIAIDSCIILDECRMFCCSSRMFTSTQNLHHLQTRLITARLAARTEPTILSNYVECPSTGETIRSSYPRCLHLCDSSDFPWTYGSILRALSYSIVLMDLLKQTPFSIRKYTLIMFHSCTVSIFVFFNNRPRSVVRRHSNGGSFLSGGLFYFFSNGFGDHNFSSMSPPHPKASGLFLTSSTLVQLKDLTVRRQISLR